MSSGASIVWGRNSGGSTYYRMGFSDAKPCGDNTWTSIGFTSAQISVSSTNNRVWIVKGNGDLYRRTNVTETNALGDDWELVQGVAEGIVKQVSVGESGVWAVTDANQLYYRVGTSIYDGNDETGSEWKHVSDDVANVSSGYGVVWGINSAQQVLFREGVSLDNVTGSNWVTVEGSLKQISVDTVNNAVWGVTSNKAIKRSFESVLVGKGSAWEQPGGGLRMVSAGQASVFGVNGHDNVFCRQITHKSSNYLGMSMNE